MSTVDSRLTRGMSKEEASEWAVWYKGNRSNLEPLVRTLEAALLASDAGQDKLDTYLQPNALAVLAHASGRRDGLREAIKLLLPRSE